MNLITLGLVLVFIVVRILESYFLIRQVHKLCEQYDWKYIETHEHLVLEIMKEDYYMEGNEWSAYRFLFFKGPNPLTMFLTFKPINLKNQYDKKALDKLKEYEII